MWNLLVKQDETSNQEGTDDHNLQKVPSSLIIEGIGFFRGVVDGSLNLGSDMADFHLNLVPSMINCITNLGGNIVDGATVHSGLLVDKVLLGSHFVRLKLQLLGIVSLPIKS